MAIYKLGDIAEIQMCKRIMSYETSSSGDVPFFKIGTLGGTPDAFISNELFEEYKNKYRYPEKGDSLISCSGTIGKVVVYDGEPSYFQDSNIVWIKSDKILKEYFYYWLNKDPFLATQGATIKRLYNSDIKNTIINLPSLKTQQEIIDIIEQNEELFLSHSNLVRIDTLEHAQHDMKEIIDIIEPVEKEIEILKNIINQLVCLGDAISKISRFRYKKLGDIASITIGGTPSTSNREFWSGGTIPWINSGKLTNSIISQDADKFITAKALKKTKLANKGEVIFSIIDPDITKVSLASEDVAVNQSVAIIKGKNKNLFFEIRNIINEMALLKNGAAQQSINKTIIENYPIRLTNNNFDSLIKSVEKFSFVIKKLEKAKKELINLLIK